MRPRLDLKRIVASKTRKASAADARTGSRPVWFGDGFHDTPVYDRDALPIGVSIQGPAIVNQMDATTVVEPDSVMTVDEFGNLMIEVQ